jgi:hypothetical protein
MNPWIETLGVCILAAIGSLMGYAFSRLSKPYWVLGYFIPLLLICLIGSTRRNSALEFVPPLSWLVAGRTEFALSALITTMVLTNPLSRLSSQRDKGFVILFMIVAVSVTSVWPFLAPAFNQNYLASLKTHIDGDGICRQSNDYNCGPAAAVTALRRLGFAAEEGQIALAAHTSPAINTPPDLLCNALQTLFQTNGLVCEYRHFKSVADLRQSGITLAVTKFGLLVGHYVAVLDLGNDQIVVGDPLLGKLTYSQDEFKDKWRFSGVVLRRAP